MVTNCRWWLRLWVWVLADTEWTSSIYSGIVLCEFETWVETWELWSGQFCWGTLLYLSLFFSSTSSSKRPALTLCCAAGTIFLLHLCAHRHSVIFIHMLKCLICVLIHDVCAGLWLNCSPCFVTGIILEVNERGNKHPISTFELNEPFLCNHRQLWRFRFR